MFLRNFWEWLRITTRTAYAPTSSSNWMNGLATSMKDIEGVQYGYLFGWSVPYNWTPNNSYYTKYMELVFRPLNPTSIRLGSGSSTPLPTDYDVDSPISSLTNVTFSATMGLSQTTGGVTMTVSCSATNIGSEPVTIRQVGICHTFTLRDVSGCNISDFSGADLRYSHPVMIAKHLLAEPIEIQPGDTKGFTVMVEMS